LAEQTPWRSRPLANPVRRLGTGSLFPRVGESAWHRRRSATTSPVPRNASPTSRVLRTATFRYDAHRRGPGSIDRASFCARIFTRSV